MAERSIVHPSEGGSIDLVGDPPEVQVTPGDRVIAAADWRNAMRGITGDGFVLGVDDHLAVVPTTPASKDVIVSEGMAWVHGSHYRSHDGGTLIDEIEDNAAEGNPRIDLIVVRLDPAERNTRARWKRGTNAASPTPPGVTQDPNGVWEIPLAELHWPAGATAVHESEEEAPTDQGWIEDRRRASVPPWAQAGVFTTISAGVDSGSSFSIPVPRRTYARLRLTLRGTLTDAANIALRVNGDSEAGLHRRGYTVRRFSDDERVGGSQDDGSFWVLAEWGTAVANTACAELMLTHANARTAFEGTGKRNSSGNLHRYTTSGGRLNSPRVVESLTVMALTATSFTSCRWWLDGYVQPNPELSMD